MVDLTQKRLKKLLEYDPDTGIFRWRVRHRATIPEDRIAGCVSMPSGYRVISVDDVSYREHRLAWLYVYGKWPDVPLDHINQDQVDNRISNLREATPQENQRNKRLPPNNTSGHVGVSRNDNGKRWIARIGVDDKIIRLGTFDSREDAITARKEAERRYGFHDNHGRPRSEWYE